MAVVACFTADSDASTAVSGLSGGSSGGVREADCGAFFEQISSLSLLFVPLFAPVLGSTSADLSRIYFAHFSSFFDHSFYHARNSGVFSAVVALIFHVSFGGIL